MELFLNQVISSILQIILFSALPFIWWFITTRKKVSFFQWIGLKRIENSQTNVWLLIIGVSIAFVLIGIFVLYQIRGVQMATSHFEGLGFSAIPAILVYAVLNTSLPEEILFRGFLLKRLQNRFGFLSANLIQATLFGLLHGIMFFGIVGITKAVLLIVFTGIIAWLMGYINEKKAGGSIIPGWIIHAVSNFISGLYMAFGLM